MPPEKTGAAWSETDIRKMITNPVYVGLGQYPTIVPESDWIAAASKMIKERGASSFLRDMLANLREAFPPNGGS